MSHRKSSSNLSDKTLEASKVEWVTVPATVTKNDIDKEYFVKGKSPILDAIDWKERINELLDLALHAKFYKVHLIVENSDLLTDSLKHELRFAGKQWVILK